MYPHYLKSLVSFKTTLCANINTKDITYTHSLKF